MGPRKTAETNRAAGSSGRGVRSISDAEYANLAERAGEALGPFEFAPLDPTETAVALRDELAVALDELTAEVDRFGNRQIVGVHPNQRPRLVAAFKSRLIETNVGAAARVANETERLCALRTALEKEA